MKLPPLPVAQPSEHALDPCYPLSSAQQRLWFLDQIKADVQDTYHLSGALEFTGQLDEEALRRSIEALVERHDVLRATIVEVNGEPFQRIHAVRPFQLRTDDLRQLSPEAREVERGRQIADECTAPFDLATGPLIRGRLLRLTADRNVLVLTLHHMVTDGWSTAVLMQDIAAFYTAFVQRLPNPLPPLPAQYEDHVVEEHQRAASNTRQRRLDYWRHRLEGAPDLLALPTDRPRPPMRGHAGSHVELVFPKPLLGALRSWAQSRDATLPMALHSGLAVLLARLSGQHDIVIGTPVANRRRPAYRHLMGFFVNTLALRVDLSDNPSAGTLLNRIRDTSRSAYLRQDVPFEQIVETIQPARNPSISPIFQVAMVMHNFDTEAIALPHATLQLTEVPPQSVDCDLMVIFRETTDGIVGRLTYATGLFENDTIQRWAGYLVRLLGAMASDDSQRVGDLPMMGEGERAFLVDRFNDTLPAQGAGLLVHGLFEAQATRTPEAVALVTKDRSWRYSDVERESNRLAHRLRSHGVVPDSRVALFMARGAEMVMAMLAVLKSGGAYVPLDPGDPPERLTRMLDDARPHVVITQAQLRAALPGLRSRVIVFDVVPGVAAAEAASQATPIDPAAIGLQPEHLAYVIYTSGSTGAPKGVAVPHSALAGLLRWQSRYHPEGPAPRTLQYMALGFDVAFQEIFSTLCGGGALVLAPEGIRRDMSALLRLLHDQRIERLILPFISLQHLAEEAALSSQALPPLRQVITGGEQLRIGTEIRELFRRLGNCKLQNQYGPTEYPVATALDLGDTPADWPFLPSIGRPIDDTWVRILDAYGQPVPIGVKGEIFIGGHGMARGYLDRDELTAACFMADPFSSQPGARLYKTGDTGRWRADGTIDFVSREDDQVKLRGFRIELGEIEAQLAQVPSVADVAVLLREDSPGIKRLVAYLTPGPGPSDADVAKKLRAHLRNVLPEYMVPGAFVMLPALPLTTNGKVDRRALPPPPEQFAGDTQAMPRNRTEEVLWEIWREVLHSTAFGVEDSFFDLGGHSLLTMQVASRVRQRLGIDVPLSLLFEHVTIAALAAWLGATPDERPSDGLSSIARIPRGEPLPVSLSQRRMWVIQQFDPASVAYNVPVSLRLRGPLDREMLQRAFDGLVERHEGLRTYFSMHADEPAQIILPTLHFPIEQIDLQQLPQSHRVGMARSLLGSRMSTPFDLTRAGLHRATLVQLDQDDFVLFWVMHHAITDNWAIAILMRELLALYAALKAGRTADLAPLAIEYADYAAWQRSPVSVAQRLPQIQYWIERLAGLRPLDLPTDFGRPPLSSSRGAKVSAVLPSILRDNLRSFCGRHAVTPYVVLLSAFKLMLARYSGGHDIAVGTPIANRHHLVTEQLVGTLVNTLVMRTDLSGNPDFLELVKRVRTTVLEAYAHQDAPFDEIVEALSPDRRSHPEGLVRTLFNVLNAPLGRLSPVEFTYEEFDLERTAAQFDLSVHIDTEFSHRIHVEYSTDLFAAVSAERFLENFLALVEQALGDSIRPISDYSIVAPAQVALVRNSWNATQLDLPSELLVHGHLRISRSELHDRVAVIDATGARMTYGALEAASNMLASALRARGISRGHLIGLSVPRDAGMLVVQLAALKSGATYVPLDPGFPVDRLNYMASDAGLSAILVPAALAAPFVKTGVPLLDPADLARMAVASPAPLALDAERDARPLDAAYLIYTSGSTGLPKAVAVPHRAVVNFLVAMARSPGLREEDRLVAVTTLSFDIAVLELLLPLAIGAQVIVANRDQVADPMQLRTLLERHEATVMQATPSTWRALIDTGWTGGAGFRALVGGEALQVALAEQLMGHCAALWNMYGPTETTVWSTSWQVQEPRKGISIGRPIANTSVWVLDATGQVCPIGVPGEAFIGGLGVTLGYHHRDALTAERFVPDPWSSEAGARLYRTGDLCRWRHDGLLEHLGRLDHQVKVRGFRIELGEIESALLNHPSVAQCVVVTRAEDRDDVRLVAYVVTDGSEIQTAALRDHLSASLPGYMLPQHLVKLTALPLLPNGKIDRGALPAPDVQATRAPARVHRPPVTHEEKVIAAIWEKLLGIEHVERTDNFFDLGGHSLLAMSAVAAGEQHLGWRIEPRRLVFETLQQLANPANT